MSPRRKFRHRLAAALAVVPLLVGISACATDSTDTSDGAADGRGDVLNVQFNGSPASLDPAQQGTGPGSIFTVLAYDPLIYLDPEGELVPSLATEWDYADDTLQVFDVTLREGVTFASGEPFNAEAVKASMDYFLGGTSGLISRLGGMSGVEVVDEYKIRITYDTPNPDAALSLSQFNMIGNIIGPDGVADPESLLTSMDGTGQYTYNREDSVPDAKYVYDRNPDYWAPEAQQFEQVVVNIMNDPNAVLAAAQTGQLDFARGSAGLASNAESSGLEIVSAPFTSWSLFIYDTEGTMNPALADPDVRRAMYLAIDREALAIVSNEEYAKPNGQFVVPGTPGYIDDFELEYDLDEAKALMKKAGYEDGFTMTMIANGIVDRDLVITQAVLDMLSEINIDVELTVETANQSAWSDAARTGKYEATVYPADAANSSLMYQSLATSPVRNPLGNIDEGMEELNASSLTVEGDERVAIFEEMTQRWHELNWSIPLVSIDTVNYVGPNITNVKMTAKNPVAIPVGPSAEYSWQPAG